MESAKRLLSYPIAVELLGFQSDTLTLQRQGWQLSMEQYFEPREYATRVRMLMYHDRAKLHALSDVLLFDTFRFANLDKDMSAYETMIRNLLFRVNYVSPRFEVMRLEEPGFSLSRFSPIDATPRFTEKKIERLEDFRLFKTIEHSKDIVVDPNDVPGLMELILKAQKPNAQELLKRQYTRGRSLQEGMILPDRDCGLGSSDQNIHAQIITLAG